MLGDRHVFRDPPVTLTLVQESTARNAARRAARESRRSLRTSRGQYRRYRATAGAVYLDWPRWHDEYLREYRQREIPGGGLQVGTDVGGGAL